MMAFVADIAGLTATSALAAGFQQLKIAPSAVVHAL